MTEPYFPRHANSPTGVAVVSEHCTAAGCEGGRVSCGFARGGEPISMACPFCRNGRRTRPASSPESAIDGESGPVLPSCGSVGTRRICLRQNGHDGEHSECHAPGWTSSPESAVALDEDYDERLCDICAEPGPVLVVCDKCQDEAHEAKAAQVALESEKAAHLATQADNVALREALEAIKADVMAGQHITGRTQRLAETALAPSPGRPFMERLEKAATLVQGAHNPACETIECARCGYARAIRALGSAKAEPLPRPTDRDDVEDWSVGTLTVDVEPAQPQPQPDVAKALRAYVDDDECKYGDGYGEPECEDGDCRFCRGRAALRGGQ